MKRVVGMPSSGKLIETFLGSDPITGAQALEELLELGDPGEEALFSRPIKYPEAVQVRRRWLRYVASREDTVLGRLIDRMQIQDRFGDPWSAAYLFAGLSQKREAAAHALQPQLESSTTYHGYLPAINRFVAWGYAGGESSVLWDYVSAGRFAWEKLSSFAFRGACAAFARTNPLDYWEVEQLITHEWRDSDLKEIGQLPDAAVSNKAVQGAELAGAAYYGVFSTWRRGEVADQILRRWSQHPHWRVRKFGAMILSSFGFQRTVTPVIEWLRREPARSVRDSLLLALERSETAAGADAFIEHFEVSGEEGRSSLARAARYASDPDCALAALTGVADYKESAVSAAEAVVSLAHLGHRYARLDTMLDSPDYYCRINAALAVGYLGEKAMIGRLLAMKREFATPVERLYLSAALAILGKPNGATELNEELVAAASLEDFRNRVDPFFMHRVLQTAILDGLAAGGAEDSLNAWRAEMEPLDPIAQPVIPRRAADFPDQSAEVVIPRGIEPVLPNTLRVFISYSHQDEKMRAKLEQHLAPLVNEGLIHIWRDREIDGGDDWEKEINKEITSADIILLLVSSAFLASRYCRNELLRALEQRSVGKSSVIPLILRSCDWEEVFNRREYKIQALPRDNRPVAGGRWPNQDVAFAEIAKEIRTKIKPLRR